MGTKTKDAVTRQIIAREIMQAGDTCTAIRKRRQYSVEEFARATAQLAENLAVLRVLDKIWEERFDDFPSLGLITSIVNGMAE